MLRGSRSSRPEQRYSLLNVKSTGAHSTPLLLPPPSSPEHQRSLSPGNQHAATSLRAIYAKRLPNKPEHNFAHLCAPRAASVLCCRVIVCVCCVVRSARALPSTCICVYNSPVNTHKLSGWFSACGGAVEAQNTNKKTKTHIHTYTHKNAVPCKKVHHSATACWFAADVRGRIVGLPLAKVVFSVNACVRARVRARVRLQCFCCGMHASYMCAHTCCVYERRARVTTTASENAVKI